MKLSEYLDGFKGLNLNLEVVFSSDEEGNNFMPVLYLPSEGHFEEVDGTFESRLSLGSRTIKKRKGATINAVCVN